MGLFSGLSKIAGPILGGLGAADPTGIISGATSAWGAQEQQKFDSNQTLKQRQFQERMSSTAHQRQVADLKKAGLNPILSTNSGASSPGGASATGQNIAGAGVNSALARKLAEANIKNVEANTDQTQTQTEAIKGLAAGGGALGDLADYVGQGLKAGEKWAQELINQFYQDKSDVTSAKGASNAKKGTIELQTGSGSKSITLD